MLILLALPVVVLVAAMHHYLVMFAPINVLVRHARSREPRCRTVAGFAVIAGSLLAAMYGVAEAVESGAPSWLNCVVLVLAWDALKVVVEAVSMMLRTIGRAIRDGMGRRRTGTPAIAG